MVLRSAVMLGALTAASGCVAISGSDVGRYVERENRRFSTTGKPDVELSTFDGSIEIRSWDRPEVEVIVEKRGPSRSSIADIEVNASQSGNHITVETRWASRTGGFHLGWSRSARLIVSVPASSDLLAKSGDGSIDVEHVDGRIELRSGDGSIRGHDIGGNLNVQTGDGSITVDGSFAGLRAHSGDGSVRVHAAAGVDASSDWEISTGDGSVTLELPDGFNADLDAHTGDGGIHVHEITLSSVTGEITRNSIRGRLGSGGRLLRVRTGDGSITLRRSQQPERGVEGGSVPTSRGL
jgi:Putative adhesin